MDLGKTRKWKTEKKIDWPQQPFYESLLNAALSNVETIEARLHRISLSSNFYNYEDIKDGLGPLAEVKNEYMGNFDKKYVRKEPNFNISIFVNPTGFFMPHCYIQINPTRDIPIETHKEFLIYFDDALPDLKVSKVEYAIDLFCSDPFGIEMLNDTVRRYLYVRNQRQVRILGDGDLSKYGRRHSIENMVTRFGPNQKVYERGEDNRKEDGGFWFEENLDRLRLEFTATRERPHLPKYNIDKLQDLIQDPKFFEINFEKWQFKQFKKRAKRGTLPRPWNYQKKNSQGYSGILQLELWRSDKLRQFRSDKLRRWFTA